MFAYQAGKLYATTFTDLKNLLEGVVDVTSVNHVIEALHDVCSEKAEHVREAWQDEGLAKHWDALASKLRRIRL